MDRRHVTANRALRYIQNWTLSVINSYATVSVFISRSPTVGAVAKLFKHRVWSKVPEGSTLIFGDNLISIKHIIA